MSEIQKVRAYIHSWPSIAEILYFNVGGWAWGSTELHFWQALLWPYYAITGVIWQ